MCIFATIANFKVHNYIKKKEENTCVYVTCANNTTALHMKW